MTEVILQNRQHHQPCHLISDISPKTGGCSNRIGESRVICILNHSALKGWNKSQMALDGNSCLSWYCDLCHSNFICWLVSLMWRLIPKMQSSCSGKQFIVLLPSQFFWAFRLFHHIRNPSSSCSSFISRAWKPSLLWKERFWSSATHWWHMRILCKYSVGICKFVIFPAHVRWPRGSGFSRTLNVKLGQDKLCQKRVYFNYLQSLSTGWELMHLHFQSWFLWQKSPKIAT